MAHFAKLNEKFMLSQFQDQFDSRADWSSVNQSCSFLAVQVASLCTSSTQKPVSDTPFGADVYKHEPVSDNLDWI